MKYNKYIPKRGIVTVQEIALRNSKDGFIPINISEPSLKEVIIPPIVGEYYSYNKDGDIKEGDRLLEIRSSDLDICVNGVSYQIHMPYKCIIASRLECIGDRYDNMIFHTMEDFSKFFNIPMQNINAIMTKRMFNPVKEYTFEYNWPNPYLIYYGKFENK